MHQAGAGKISPSALIILFIALKSVQIVWNGLAWHTFLLFPPPTRWRSLLAAIVEICSENCAGWCQAGRTFYFHRNIFRPFFRFFGSTFFFFLVHSFRRTRPNWDWLWWNVFGQFFSVGMNNSKVYYMKYRKKISAASGVGLKCVGAGIKWPGSQSGTRTLESPPVYASVMCPTEMGITPYSLAWIDNAGALQICRFFSRFFFSSFLRNVPPPSACPSSETWNDTVTLRRDESTWTKIWCSDAGRKLQRAPHQSNRYRFSWGSGCCLPASMACHGLLMLFRAHKTILIASNAIPKRAYREMCGS